MQDKLKNRLYDEVLIFDGAIGTEIYKRHFFVNTSFDGLCLTNPDVISDIHKQYYDAGADVLTTNSFGANRNKLSRFGLADQVKEINIAAAKLARESGDENTLIAGSVGPIGDIPFGKKKNEGKVVEMLVEQIAALEEGGVDFIIFETLSEVADVEFAFKSINELSKLPFILSFSVDRNAESAKGEPAQNILNSFNRDGRKPTAIGLNCGEGPEGLLSAIEIIDKLVEYPIVAQPNAGIPKNVDGRMIYMSSPEYLTTYSTRFVNLGVRGIGGCCGTGPEHIKNIAQSVKPLAKSAFSSSLSVTESEELLQKPVPTKEKSKFAQKIEKGEWATSVEIVPPRGYELQQTIDKSLICRKAGVDAINIPDGPRASSRISPIITALEIQEKAEIESFLHFCCRDKNLIGMQADLLGCAAVGINNILIITGDPPKLGDHPYASAVFDVDSIGMVKIQDRLNKGVDLGGKAISKKTSAYIAVGADPNAIDMEREIRRMREKAEAGAELIITQPVFAVEPLLKFLEDISDLNLPVVAGIWPLASYRNAEFMKNEVPGVLVPDSIMERMSKFEGKDDQKKEGILIACESVEKIRDSVNGIQVSAPFGNVQTAISVIKGS